MKYTALQFIKNQWSKQAPVEHVDLSSKTVIVVGANTGLGLEAVKHFATMNAGRIIMACRNESKGKAAVEVVKKATGYDKAELWLLDLANFSTVTAFADKFEKDGGRLDLLLCNAGIALDIYEATPDNWESTVQVNHLSTALLSLLLLPHLLKTANETNTVPRLVVVASDVHYWAEISKKEQAAPNIIELLGSKEYCTKSAMAQRYSTSKILNVLFVRALNDRLSSSTPLVVNAVNPAFCISEIRRSISFPVNILTAVMDKVLALTTEEGSRQLVYASVCGKDDEMRGAFISSTSVWEPSDFVVSAEGKEVQNRIWDETIEILSKQSPELKTIVAQHLIT